jgi:hypothetical protein
LDGIVTTFEGGISFNETDRLRPDVVEKPLLSLLFVPTDASLHRLATGVPFVPEQHVQLLA